MHIELHALDRRFLPAGKMQMVAIEAQLFQLVFELVKIDAQVE